jgi:hypothetical protein
MKPSQPTLPGVRDWTQPVEIRSGELGALVIEAASAGFMAIRMEVLPKGTGYKATFQKMTGQDGHGNTAKPPRRVFSTFAELSQPKERD